MLPNIGTLSRKVDTKVPGNGRKVKRGNVIFYAWTPEVGDETVLQQNMRTRCDLNNVSHIHPNPHRHFRIVLLQASLLCRFREGELRNDVDGKRKIRPSEAILKRTNNRCLIFDTPCMNNNSLLRFLHARETVGRFLTLRFHQHILVVELGSMNWVHLRRIDGHGT